ncbi:LPXTG-motif cell wall anchor domain protein [Lactobacillus hamsteri DSM 5661 = JCM 6256]|uniref:LPXTG-motif cell wall anchor domain protein n=1 Tax=Lactobacillus hamsteri DSM 5661 = JCM 6256 TaxID=1423754 RepID=A0A0R1YH76_9LACO|nr:LPXTG-motif cell wall anchor domain protein [Lactobacillus hamsteri DSM 5661 = JCM 6256]
MFLTTNNVETVHADETNIDKDNTATAINNSSSTGDINQKVVPSTQGQTSESDSKNHETVNTDTEKTDDQKLKENDVQKDTDNTAQQGQTEQGSNKPVNDKEGQQSTQQVQKDINVEKTKNTVQSTEDTIQNFNVSNQTNPGNEPVLEKALKESKATENLAPDPYTQDDSMSYIMGTDIANHAASFLKNGQKLLEAGAKITWETPLQTPTESDFESNPMHGKVSVTLNGTTSIVDVAAIPVDQPIKLNGSATHRYYYINNVGDKGPDSVTQKDAQEMELYNPNEDEEHNLLVPTEGNYGFTYEYKLPDQIDTSSMGIKFLKIEATVTPDEDNKDYFLNTGAVTINVPYLVKDLPLQADTNQPVYVQKGDGDNGDSGYLDLTQADGDGANSSGFGRYFYGTASNGYQDYALAYALGIGAVSNFNNASGDNKDATSMEVKINVPKAEGHMFHVVQVTPDEVPAGKPLYIFKHGGNPNVGPNKIVNTLKDQTTYVQNDLLNPITPAGAVFAGTGAEATSKAVKSSENHYTFQYTAYYGSFDKSGNTQIPLLSNTSKYASQEFIDEIAKTYQTLGFNNEWATTGISNQGYAPAVFKNRAGDIYIIDQPEANQMEDNVCDVTDGPSTLTNPDDIAKLLQAPATLDGKWPTGTTFEWVDKDGQPADPMTFTQAGQAKTGYIKVHLAMPDGMTKAQQGWWYDHIVPVQAISKAKTINPGQDVAYGTPLSAADLVTNKDQFPEGTTFHYASRDADGHLCYQNNDGKWVYDAEQPDGTTQQVEATGEVKSTEPNWTKGGEYANVGIYADYTLTGADGLKKQVQSTPTTATVTINRYVNYYVVAGGDLPTDPSSLIHFNNDLVKDPLEFSGGFTQVGSDTAAQLSNQKSNQAQFTVHFKNSNTTVKLYLNVIVIPKIDGVSDQWFNANGSHNQTIDTVHQTGDYTIANGQAASQLTDYTDADGSYQGYQSNKDNTAEGGSFSQTTEAYQPGMTVTGLSTNSANELIGGKQTATVRIDVPKGTHGGNGVTILTDNKGNSYYNLEVPINVVFSGNITVDGKQTVTYNADQQHIDQRHSDNYVGTIVISNPSADGNLTVSVELTNNDLQFVDAHGNPTIAPTNAGTYHVGLKRSGIQKVKAAVEAASAQSPYKYDVSYDTTKFADFIVNKADGKAFFTGEGTKTYDGSAIANYQPSVTIAAQGVDPDTKVDLTAGTDYVWYLTDGAGGKKGTALTTAPVDAGNYVVELTDAGKSKITSLNAANIDWTKPGAITESASYIINKATAPITFVTQDGQSITTPSEFNLANYQIKVGIPGEENYQLTGKVENNLIFIDKDGVQWQQVPSAPGSYQVELSNLAISAIKAHYDKYSKNYNFVNEAYSMLNIDAASAQISFVDTENNDRLVGKAQMITGSAGATIEFTGANALKFDNSIYELVPGQQDSVKLGAEGTNTPVTIKLKHKHEKIKVAQTLTFTVDYKYANGDQAGQQAAKSVQWGGFYSRIRDIDKVTNVETFTDWQFDPSYNKDGFSNGYKVISGNWSAPEDGKVTVIDTPNVNGYIAFTNADGTNANQFNIANPKGTETHTVYYAQVQTDPRTVTAEFHFWENNKDAGTAAPSAELQVFYKKAPTNVRVDSQGQIHVTYGGWEWDKAAGDPQTPGIHVISGSTEGKNKLWNNVNDATGGFSVNAPNIDGYTPINLREDSANTTVNFSSPTLNPNTLFTNDTDGTWYNRNRLVTFYVPDTDLNRTIKRTIEVYNPDGTVTTIPQQVEFSRTGKVNKGAGTAENPGDTGVVFSDFTPASGTWAEYDVANKGDYTILIDGHEVAGNKIPLVTVTPDTKDTTVKVTYTASATAKLTGSASSDYTGSQIAWNNVISTDNGSNIAVTVTGPTAGSYTLQKGDLEFSADGTKWSTDLPTNAGTYQMRWSAAGITNIKKQFGNNSITWGTNDADITSDATYTINKAKGTAVFSGTSTKTYDGSAIADYQPTVTVPAPGTATSVDLNAGTDYVWYLLDADGHKTGAALTTAPVDAGNYTVELTSAGKGKITALNADNINWTDADITGTGSYIINKATATVNFTENSGQTVDYSGQTGKFDASKFVPTISTNNQQALTIPNGVNLSLAAGDFTINGVETTTEPVELGTYTIGLSKSGFAKLQSATNNYNWVNSAKASYIIKANDKATITVTNNVADGGHQTVVYKGSAYNANNIDLADYALTLPTGLTYHLQAGDLELVGDPTNVGTCTVQLSEQGKTNLQKAAGDKFIFDFNKEGVANSTASFEITKATPTVVFGGTGSKTYGQNDETWTKPADLTITNAPGMGNETISLANSDYEFVGQDGTVYSSVPTNVGTYTVRLSDQGKAKVTGSTINAGNLDWAKAAISGEGSFTVKAAEASAALSGANNRDYNGSAVSTADINNGGNIVVTISIPGTTNTISYKLADGDYTWKDNADPINVGTYTIELNKANILAHLQAQIANDPAWKGNVTLAAAKLSGNATFTINQKAANVSLTGNNDASVPPYSGKAATMPVDALKNALTNSDNLDLSGLTADGFDWYDAAGTTKIAAPTNAGSYTIKLNDTGLSEIQTKNSNYKVSIATPNNYGFKIKKVNGHVVLNNNATDAFTGVANNDVYKNYTLTLSTDTPVTDQIGYTLKPGDLQFLVNGTWTSNVPTAVGKYEVRLGQTGWDNLKKSLNNNSQNINWVATDTPKDKNYYTITAASATANLAGQNSMVYNGQAPTANDVNGGTIEVTLTFPGATDANKVFKLTDASYYTWNTSDHTNVGNYTITLTNAGKTAIQNYIDSIVGEGNITLPTDKVTGSAKFDITPAQLTVEQGGNGSKTYDGKAANVGTTNLTNKNNWSVTGMMGGESFNIPATLTKTDFDWYQVNADGSETKLNGVPTNAGNYAIKLNAAGLTKLNAANKNYNIASDKLSGKYSYTINKANAVISLDSTANKQDATWTGSTIAVDPTNFVPSIKDTSNNKTIALPNVQLTADDYTVAGNPVEPGSYNVTLTENGWKKVADAVSGTDNYNWSYSGNGILTIAKKQQAITISGSQTVIYSGDPAVLPTNADGTLKGYTVDLGNGLTYQLKDGDLEFVQAAHTDADTYKLKLSAAGLENIKKLAAGDHYDYSYTYDETNNSAELIVAKATATYALSGGQSSTYNGSPVSIDLNKDHTYSITITMNNGQQVTYQLTNADLAFKSGSAPTARGRYDVVLSNTGLEHLKALNANYNWDTDKSTSTAYYEINPAEMFVGIGGTTHTVYNGQVQPVPADELSDLHLIWGGSETKPSDTTSIQLQAGDFDYYQKNADGTFSKVDPKDAKTYYLVLNQAGLDRLNAANPNGNYTFELNNDPKQVNYGTYVINQLNAKVTLTGSQSAEYGYAQDLNVHNFHIVLRDENGKQIIEVPDDVLASGDLLIKNYAADKHPADVGTYDVEIQPSLIEKLKQKYTDFNFDPVTSRDTNSDGLSEAVVQKNNDGKYIITTVDAYISISGSQTVPYNADHSYSIGNSYSVTLKDKQDKVITLPDDIKSKLQFQFVASPTNAGNYEVTLTPKSISLIETIGANNSNGEDNYAWHSNIQPQSYVVTPLEVTANVANAGTEPASSIYGESINLDDHLGAYTITLTDKSTNKPITYTLQKGDLVFVTEPTNVGTYEVQLSQAGINHIQEQYPTQNYTITYGHTATFKVTAATPTITITANGKTQKTYDANPAEIKPGDFTVSITTNNGQTIDYQLSGSDLQFDGNAPTDAGQYEVKLKPSVIDKLKQQFPNYNWDADSVTNAAGKFTITAANGSAVLSGNVSKSYDGSGISDLSPIKVTVDYPGVGTNTTYTLTNDDYVIVNDSTGKQYKPSEAPANVGDYHIELTQTGKDNIAKLGNSKQHHNINWTADSFTGNATYKISAISISVSGKGKQTATYDGTSFGNADKLDLSKFVPMLNANGVKVPTIPANTLTDGDYTIKNSNDETVTDPTDAGEYTVWLNEKGLNKLKSLSSNFTWSAAPIQVGTLTINPFEVTVTIKGNAEVDSGVTAIPDHTYSFDFTNKENSKWPEGWKQPTISVSDLDFDGSRPAETTKNGTFTVNYKGGQAALQKLLGNNYKVTYVAGNNNFVVAPQEHTGKISYIDPNDPNKEIGSTPLKGKTGDEIKITPAPPAGWKVVPDQDIPTTVTVTKDGIPTITVKVEHDTIVVTPDDPKTPNDKLPDTINKGPNYPGNNYPAGVAHDDLNKTITRTIIEKLPSGDKKIEQIVTFTRTATIDLVTGKVSHGEWTKSGSWDKFTAENVPGYTANPKQVEAEDVTIETNDKTVTINYTRDAQPTTPGGNDGDGDLPTPPTPPANPDQGSGDHGGTTPPNPSNPVQPSGGSKPDEKPSDKPGNKPGKPTKPEEPGKKPTKPNNPSKSKPTKSNKTKTTRPSQTITKAPGKAPKKGRYDNVTPPNGSDVPNGLPAGTHWKNAALIGPNGEVYYKNGHWSYAGRKALPQTGAHDNVLATVFGSLAAGLGILGLFGVHKKKKDE